VDGLREYWRRVAVVGAVTVLAVAALFVASGGQSQSLSNDALADALFPGDFGLKRCVSEKGTLPDGRSYERSCHLSRACSETSGLVTERTMWVRVHGRRYDVVEDTGPGPC
jgi:hypothetical protein